MGELDEIEKLNKDLTEEEFYANKSKILNDKKIEDKKNGDIKFWIFSGMVIGISLLIIILVGSERSNNRNKLTNSNNFEVESNIKSEENTLKSNTSNNNYNTPSRTQSSTFYQDTKPKTKVYSATALNGEKIHNVDSKTGYVSYSRYCQYCGNEWDKSASFTIRNTELYQISSGYCPKCKKYVGNVQIHCTVIEQ